MRNSLPTLFTQLQTNQISKRLSFSKQSSSKNQFRSERNSFQTAIYPILFVAQIFGLFPIYGISAPYSTHLKFKWFSLKTIYSLVSICIALFWVCAELIRLSREDDPNAKNLAGAVFFTVTTLTGIIFFHIATKWRKIMMFWEKNETVFLKRPFKTSAALKRKIYFSGMFLFCVATVEHLLSRASSFYGYNFEAKYCNKTVRSYLSYYAHRDYHQTFTWFPYHPVLALSIYIHQGFLTFAWNFLDYFIIAISIGISERFRQFSEYLNDIYLSSSPKMNSAQFWKTIRYQYGLICEILEFVDSSVSVVIVLSCLSNLYFICLQVLNVATKLPYTINEVYFWSSLVYLIFRTVAVFLCASEVNEQAVRPLETLRHLSNAVWNVDIERLADQIRSETIALTGMKFYYMTRRLLFGMMGTIITYEIVLMQFDQSSKYPYSIHCEFIVVPN